MPGVGTDRLTLLPTRWRADVDANALAWSPDERRLATGCEDGGAAVFGAP